MSTLPFLFVQFLVELRKGKAAMTVDEFVERPGMISPSKSANPSPMYGFEAESIIEFHTFSYFYRFSKALFMLARESYRLREGGFNYG